MRSRSLQPLLHLQGLPRLRQLEYTPAGWTIYSATISSVRYQALPCRQTCRMRRAAPVVQAEDLKMPCPRLSVEAPRLALPPTTEDRVEVTVETH